MKPMPLVMFCWKTFSKAIDIDAPATPAIIPPKVTVA